MITNSKKSESGRIEFDRGVPEILFKRANGKCSVPRCKKPTMGPFSESDGAVNMGIACHIYSAAENGPRGRGGKDGAFISSEQNGIWCCSYHANLIDKNKGNDYPATVLFAWKALVEARALKQMNDTPSPLGWVESIEFLTFPVKNTLPKAILSRRTLVWGRNGSGKTSLLEVAASITKSKYAERFSSTKRMSENGKHEHLTFSSRIIYSTVDSFSKEIDIEITGDNITRHENQVTCLLPPGDIEVVYCSQDDLQKIEDEDDIDFMMRVLNVDKVTLFALAQIGTKSLIPGEIKFQRAMDYIDDGDVLHPLSKDNGQPYYELAFKKEKEESFIPVECLSGTEKDRLILDFLITKAREVCKQRLTLLLIENLSILFDSDNFKSLLINLEKEDFQVVITLPPSREKELLNFTLQTPQLKPLDYLETWRLSIIGDL